MWMKNFGLIFLALSSVTNLKGQFIRVHKVIWQLLWRLKDHLCNNQEVVENTSFWKKKRKFPSE